MRIITAGPKYSDIDVYGGITAYAELLRNQGIEAQAVTTATLNDSIPPLVRVWKVNLAREYKPAPGDTFTLIDVSEPGYFEKFVDLERVDEIIDHHPGFEDFWHAKIGDRALIEQVGAACTQVVERWQQAGLIDQITETSARLLMCGHCTLKWDKKSVGYVNDEVVHFKDGDWFNSVTGNGMHRYGKLVVAGKCQMSDAYANTRHFAGRRV
jgi:nanoRNase/pAp phosphatase (c-di-AMP/oligoRNAs hydrolase)